jgi:hypothetical protein
MTQIIVPLYRFLNSRIKRFFSLAKVAKERKLNFSNLDEVGSSVIAIDTAKRKLLYLKSAPDNSSCLILDLNNLHECTIKKQYNGINAGDLNKRKMSDFLRSVFLNLRFKGDPATITLSLYEAHKDKQDDLEQLEANAKKWETIVSKLLSVQILARA